MEWVEWIGAVIGVVIGVVILYWMSGGFGLLVKAMVETGYLEKNLGDMEGRPDREPWLETTLRVLAKVGLYLVTVVFMFGIIFIGDMMGVSW